MKLVIFANDLVSVTESHNPGTNKPIHRRNVILNAIEQKLENIDVCTVKDEIDKKWIAQVHHPDYLDFLEKCYSDFIRSGDLMWANDNYGVIPQSFCNRKSPNIPIYKLAGFYTNDFMTPIYADTFSNAMVSANQAYLAGKHLAQKRDDLIYVLATSPGHHAKYARYGGYCFINNAIVGALSYIKERPDHQIVILDLDYHAGNGTIEMIDNLGCANIETISIHCDPTYDYPSHEGFSDERNFVLPQHCDWQTYKSVLNQVCDIISDCTVDMLIISFGADTFKDDPDAHPLAKFTLDIDDYREMGSIIKSYFGGMPKMIVQEGGYNFESVGDIVCNFISGIRS